MAEWKQPFTANSFKSESTKLTWIIESCVCAKIIQNGSYAIISSEKYNEPVQELLPAIYKNSSGVVQLCNSSLLFHVTINFDMRHHPNTPLLLICIILITKYDNMQFAPLHLPLALSWMCGTYAGIYPCSIDSLLSPFWTYSCPGLAHAIQQCETCCDLFRNLFLSCSHPSCHCVRLAFCDHSGLVASVLCAATLRAFFQAAANSNSQSFNSLSVRYLPLLLN